MQFNSPTTLNEMYEVLKEIFNHYRVNNSPLPSINLNEIYLSIIPPIQASDEDIQQRASDLLSAEKEEEILKRQEQINAKIYELNNMYLKVDGEVLAQKQLAYENMQTKLKAVANGYCTDKKYLYALTEVEMNVNDEYYFKCIELEEQGEAKKQNINDRITALQQELSSVEDFVEQLYEKKVFVKSLEIATQYIKYTDNVVKYNNTIAEKNAQHHNNIVQAKANLSVKYYEINNKEYTKQQLIEMGYYQDAVKAVCDYLNTLSPVTAYNVLVTEGRIAVYLEDYYQSLVYSYQMLATS